MFIVLIRTIILYGLVVVIMRLMGKRQIGELQPFELVITIMISDLASLPMQDTRIPLLHGVIPIITLLIAQIFLSELQLKSEKMRTLIDGRPSILIKNGKIETKQLRDQRMSINDLLEELRISGYLNITDIAYAILETDGQLSIIPKSDYEKVTRQDLKIKAKEIKLPIVIISDGEISKEGLRILKQDEKWIKSKLKANNISSEKEVLVALIDSEGKFFYQLKDDKNQP